MSGYGVIHDSYWTGRTGRQIRTLGRDAQVLGAYLFSSSHANIIGLYYLPIAYVVEDLGGSGPALERALAGLGALDQAEGPSKGLRWGSDGAFALYDSASSFVWVVEMARIRLGLKDGGFLHAPDGDNRKWDKRIASVNKQYAACGDNPFLGSFFDYYGAALRIEKRREGRIQYKPLEGASKGHRRGSHQRGSDLDPVLASDVLPLPGSQETTSLSGPATAGAAAARAVDGKAINAFLKWFVDSYPEHNRGAKFKVTGTVDVPLVRSLLGTWDLEHLKLLALRLWSDRSDEFISTSDRTIRILSIKATYLDGRLAAERPAPAWDCPHEPRCKHRAACTVVSMRPARAGA